MIYQSGKVVRIKHKDKIVDATLLEPLTIEDINYWWYQVTNINGTVDITIIEESEISRYTWSSSTNCTCGCAAVNSTRHSYYCELYKI